MKKYLISISKLAAATIVAFTLAACGEEVQIQENPNVKKVTKFTSGNGGTRTSMDSERHFYWYQNDQIWVDTDGNGTFTTMSDYSNISQDAKSADFYVSGVDLTAPSYSVLYTGNGSTTPTSVTIPATRTYNSWNDKDAFGKSGDCGTATATRNSAGNYTFQLKHEAAYIVALPFIYALRKGIFGVRKIIITSENSTIAGTYPFSMSGLDTQNVTNASNTITVDIVGAIGPKEHIPIVIQPGRHKLNITFVGVGNDGMSREYLFQLPERNYLPNSSTNFSQHIFAEYYQWDAPMVGKFYDDSFNTTPDEAASQSCVNMPNVNEMSWYMLNGSMRWDSSEEWEFGHLAGDPGNLRYKGGVWIKKKAVILADNTLSKCPNAAHGGNGPTFCSEHSVNGSDMRITATTGYFSHNNLGIAQTYKNAGRPDDSVIGNYFFIPATGICNRTTNQVDQVGMVGYHWSSTPFIGSPNYAWVFAFDAYSCAIKGYEREYLCVAHPGIFK